MKQNINNILYIVVLLFIILLICIKAVDLHNNIMNTTEVAPLNIFEKFEAEGEKKMLGALSKVYNVNEQIKEAGESDADRDDLIEKCKNLGKSDFGSIVSKYSGKVINVEKEPNSPAGKTRYIIKWEPLGGKPGGCVTANVDGSYSTPICNHNIDKQLWEIIEVKDVEQFTELIETYGGKDRLKMGRPLDETSYPFHIVKATKHDFVLNYEGGGLSVRKLANYDSQKWDGSINSIKQDPMPTQSYNKHSSLTPGHNFSAGDTEASNVGLNGLNGKNNSKDGVNFNINVDPELLQKLLRDEVYSNEYSDNNDNEYSDNLYQNSNNKFNRSLNSNDTESMLVNREQCDNCGDIPERFIRKDLVKSMCPGCNKLDNVKT